MKKFLSITLVFALLVCAMLSLTSCSNTLSGTYEYDESQHEDQLGGLGSIIGGVVSALANTTYEFSFSAVTVKIDKAFGDDVEFSGKYKITEADDGKMTITFTFEGVEDENAEDYSGTFDFFKAKDGSYIEIGGVKYLKKVETNS